MTLEDKEEVVSGASLPIKIDGYFLYRTSHDFEKTSKKQLFSKLFCLQKLASGQNDVSFLKILTDTQEISQELAIFLTFQEMENLYEKRFPKQCRFQMCITCMYPKKAWKSDCFRLLECNFILLVPSHFLNSCATAGKNVFCVCVNRNTLFFSMTSGAKGKYSFF